MPDPATPENSPGSVRTPMPTYSADCVVCTKTLTGKQTHVCGGKCRVALHRCKQAAERMARDAHIRRHLEHALELLLHPQQKEEMNKTRPTTQAD